MKRAFLALSLASILGLSGHATQAQTLKTVRDRGFLSCGVSQALPGFSSADDNGNWAGLALQLPFLWTSESIGNHDSKIMDACGVG
jgi:general L-amino acid transport system substrate-binding protein